MSKTLSQLSKLSARLYNLIDDLNGVMGDIDNSQLFIILEADVHDALENAATQLDEITDDMDNGLYEDEPQDEGDLDWD